MSMYYSPLTVSTDTPSGALERTRHTILGWPSRSGMTGCFVQACEAFTDRVNGLEEVVLPGSFPLLGARTPLQRRRIRNGRRTLRIVRVLAHASNRSCPPTLTASRAHVGYASTGRPSARARRRRQAPRSLRVRSLKACTRQVSKPQCRRNPTTTRRPARAYSTHYAINSSCARPRCWTRR